MGSMCIQALIYLSLACRLTAAAIPVELTANPDKPKVNGIVELKCKVKTTDTINIVRFNVPDVNSSSGKALIMFNWIMKTDAVVPDGKWKNPDEYTITKDKARKTFSLSFTVTPEDRLKYQCIAVGAADFGQAFKELEVQTAPIVTSLKLYGDNGKTVDRVKVGQKVKVECVINLGNPAMRASDIKFSAPGIGSNVATSGTDTTTPHKYTIKTLTLSKEMRLQDNSKTVECSGANSVASGRETLRVNVVYGPRNTKLTIKHNANVSVGDTVTCTADGNPAPSVRIFITGYSQKDAAWASKGASGKRTAQLKIPLKATLARYHISCNASNEFGKDQVPAIPVYVVERMISSAGLIGGAILAFIVLVIIVAVIYYFVQRRQKNSTKQERNSELEKDIGPYDIDDMDKSGGRPYSDASRYQMPPYGPGCERPEPTGGSNGNNPYAESESGVEQTLNYASLDFDETPRSRMPIIFKDTDKVDYAEIVSSLGDTTIGYDDDHTYENVRHHNV